MKVAVVIPALNEAGTVGTVAAAVRRFGTPVVVDDGSIDATGATAEAAGAAVVAHRQRRGYDAALASGFSWADEHGFDAVASIDADAQHDPDLLASLLKPLQSSDVDMVLGIRPKPARVSERLFSLYARTRFGVPDILCGMKAFKIDIYRAHRSAMARPSIGTGLALAGLRAGVPFELLDVPIRPRQDHARFGQGLKANLRILRALGEALITDALSARSR